MSEHRNNELTQAIKKVIQTNQSNIREDVLKNGNIVPPRTQAVNSKYPAKTVEEDKEFKGDILGAQISSWKEMMPNILKKFSKVPDKRRLKSVRHAMATILMFGLLIFIFRFPSRKAINNKLAEPVFLDNMRNIFPEIETLPHSDTVGRVLKKVPPDYLEEALVDLVKNLIRKKKFDALKVFGHLPISIDGVQKIIRNGQLQDENWLERKVSNNKGNIQQYVYVLEANITLPNGLSIPLLSEFLYYDGNANPTKQDCELTAFKRISDKLKKHFKRQQIILCLDKLYPNETTMDKIQKSGWEYIMVLPSNKFKHLNSALNDAKKSRICLPNQVSYRGRKQEWYWRNGEQFNKHRKVNVVACFERWEEVNTLTGEIEPKFSEHRWVTSINVQLYILHELCNLCARKRWGIEDSNNTEKNRGYNYKHAFSLDWNAMICFHILMRLAHAINVLSEYTKKLAKYIKTYGSKFILDLIKDVLWAPWFDRDWYSKTLHKKVTFILTGITPSI